MTSILGQSVADHYVGTLSQMKKANSVAHKLLGQPGPKPESPPHEGSSIAEVVAYHIADIEYSYDPECPERRDVVWLGAQYAQRVASGASFLSGHWRLMCPDWTEKKLTSYVHNKVDTFSCSVEPALYAAEKEYDRHGQLRRGYEKIQKRLRSGLTEFDASFPSNCLLEIKHKQSQIREQGANVMQVLLFDLAAKLRGWSDLFPQDSSKLPNRR